MAIVYATDRDQYKYTPSIEYQRGTCILKSTNLFYDHSNENGYKNLDIYIKQVSDVHCFDEMDSSTCELQKMMRLCNDSNFQLPCKKTCGQCTETPITTTAISKTTTAPLVESPNLQCITHGGNSAGASCKFPFIYDMWDDIPYLPFSIFRLLSRKKKFDSCTDYDYRKRPQKRWCATKVTSNNRYIPGHWGECPNNVACNTKDGAWLSWGAWEKWTDCAGANCGEYGTRKRYRLRKKFHRDESINNRGPNEQTKHQSNSCLMPACPGWKTRICRGGTDIFTAKESHLISLVSTEEECETICAAMPECTLAVFDPTSYKEINKCVPKRGKIGKCDEDSFFAQRFRSYIKDSSDTNSSTLSHYSQDHWTWNATHRGSEKDCRLCFPGRPSTVWPTCNRDCKVMPTEISDIKLFIEISKRFGMLSSMENSNAKARKRFINLFRNNELIRPLLKTGNFSDININKLSN